MAATATHTIPLVYEQIKQRLRSKIARDWPVGTKLPPMPQLARELGAGQTNTHRAVKELADEGRLASRPGRGTFVQSQRGARKRATPLSVSRRARSTPKICMALRYRAVAEMTRLMEDGFAQGIAAAGFNLEEASLNVTPEVMKTPSEYDAAMIINPDSSPPIVVPDDQRLVVITTAVELPLEKEAGYDVVTVDQDQGGFLAGAQARRLGCRRPCFVGVRSLDNRNDYDRTSQSRLHGFERGYGNAVTDKSRIRMKHYGPMNGGRAVREFLKLRPRPDFVFCASDELAMGFATGAASHGIEVGRDVHLVGFDRQQHVPSANSVNLTTIEVPALEMGRRAAELLIDRLENPNQPVRRLALGCTLHRAST